MLYSENIVSHTPADEPTSDSRTAVPGNEANMNPNKLLLDHVLRVLTTAFSQIDLAKYATEAEHAGGIDFHASVRAHKISLVRYAMKKCGGRQKAAADLIGLKPSTLSMIIKKYEIDL